MEIDAGVDESHRGEGGRSNGGEEGGVIMLPKCHATV